MLQFTQYHQISTLEDWKTLLGLMSLNSSAALDGRVRFGVNNMEACLISMVQATVGDVMVWGIISYILWVS